MNQPIICDIIKKSYLVARDSSGNEYPVIDYHENGVTEEIELEQCPGELFTSTEQTRYDDGSYAREYSVISYFRPIEFDKIPNYTKSSGVIDEEINPLEYTR